MRFATISAAALAFAVSAIAQTPGFDAITSPLENEKVPAGSKLTIKWQPGQVKGAVKIGLIGGATQGTQVPLTTIQSGIDNQAGSYEWDVPATLGDKAVYGLTITLESSPETFQYSFPFHITAKEGAVSSAGGYKASGLPTVTVSLSSASSSAAATSTSAHAASSAAASTSKAAVPTTSAAAPTYSAVAPPSNSTATYSVGNGASTTLATVTGGSGSKPTGTPVSVPTAGASRVAAGSVFALGAVAAFFFM